MNKMKISYSALLLVALGFLLPEESTAAACTPGTDCYCDKVKDPGNDDCDGGPGKDQVEGLDGGRPDCENTKYPLASQYGIVNRPQPAPISK